MNKEFKKLKLDELNRISPEAFSSLKKLPIIVILDNIRSLNNIGSIFRTADAFLIEEIWLSGITAKPPHREIQKTALGATETVLWKYFQHPSDIISEIKKRDYKLVAIEQTTNSKNLSQLQINCQKGIGIILGNEVDGVSVEFLGHVNESIEIQQEGTKHSLNVSVAAGIVLYDLFIKLN